MLNQTISTLYRYARIGAWFRAASKGPDALAKRYIRKQVYKRVGRLLR